MYCARRSLFSQRVLSKRSRGFVITYIHMSIAAPAGKARIALTLSTSDEDIERAGEKLRAGGLVAFPTETVYGLGANALNEAAVKSIFVTKGRPLTDPLIVHVPSPSAALDLLQLDPIDVPLYKHLAKTFWPGPLTLVGKAHPSIPLSVTAGTGMVGLRCPNHPVAVRLLEAARVPIAAPSANRFGHVSPTAADHVLEDLGTHDIFIVDGGRCAGGVTLTDVENSRTVDCLVGIESTVAKVDSENKKIVLFRRGGISQCQLEAALRDGAFSDYVVDVRAKVVIHEEEATTGLKTVGEEAPGQHLTHYAPDVPATLLTVLEPEVEVGHSMVENAFPSEEEWNVSVLLDFGGQMKWLKERALAYMDLSPSGDMDEAANKLFAGLRWSETVIGAERVFLPNIDEEKFDHPHRDAVKDRLFRSASGRTMMVRRR